MTYLIFILFSLILGFSLGSGLWWPVPASVAVVLFCAAVTAGLVYFVPRQRQIVSAVRVFWHESKMLLMILAVGFMFLALGIIWKGVITGA